MNYYDDPRVIASEPGLLREINDRNMTAFVDEMEVPIHYVVCPTCNGRGKHVNPSIDCNGLTAEDFEQDLI